MEFLADENIDRPVVEKLRGRGYDVASVDAEEKGISDEKVLDKAVEENRVIITFDKDFSEIDRDHPGVLRITSPDRHDIIVEMIEEISSSFTEDDFRNTVVEASPRSYV